MIVHLPTNATIAPSYTEPGTYYLYRDSGEEVAVTVSDERITHSTHLLNLIEVQYILDYVVKKKGDENRFIQLESNM